MIPDRWTLREWSRYGFAFGILCYLIAEVLERADSDARATAESAVRRHEWDEHQEEGLADD